MEKQKNQKKMGFGFFVPKAPFPFLKNINKIVTPLVFMGTNK